MLNPSPDRKVLEEVWRLRLHNAKLRLDFARNNLKNTVEDFPPRDTSSADGRVAYPQAVTADAAALREYARILRIYHDLTVNGAVPDERQWIRTQHSAINSQKHSLIDKVGGDGENHGPRSSSGSSVSSERRALEDPGIGEFWTQGSPYNSHSIMSAKS